MLSVWWPSRQSYAWTYKAVLSIAKQHKGAFCHDLADPLNSMFKIADPFSASATCLYRPKHFLAVSFFLEIHTPCRKKFNVEIMWNKHLISILTAKSDKLQLWMFGEFRQTSQKSSSNTCTKKMRPSCNPQKFFLCTEKAPLDFRSLN